MDPCPRTPAHGSWTSGPVSMMRPPPTLGHYYPCPTTRYRPSPNGRHLAGRRLPAARHRLQTVSSWIWVRICAVAIMGCDIALICAVAMLGGDAVPAIGEHARPHVGAPSARKTSTTHPLLSTGPVAITHCPKCRNPYGEFFFETSLLFR